MTRNLFVLISTLYSLISLSYAQCIVLPTATSAGIYLQCAGGQNNRSGLAFNPAYNLYYSVDAGSSGYPIETYDINGTLVSTVAQGNDYRGLWWNDSLSQLEGNSYGSGPLVVQSLNASGTAIGTVTQIFPSISQPDAQSCGVYDPLNRWILFSYNSTLYKFNRYTNTPAGTVAITGLPGVINTTSLIYTGCTGMEIGLYDYQQSKLYFVNETTGSYVSQIQLPATSPTNDRFRLAFANNLLWIFEPTLLRWESFNIFQPTAVKNETEMLIEVLPNPANDYIYFMFSNANDNYQIDISDISGKAIEEIKNISGRNYMISLKEKSKGVYFYSVYSKNSSSFRKGKFVIE